MSKTLVGIVASDKADKTITVLVQSSKTHPLYRKKYMASKKFMAHDEKNEAKEGDRVAIIETRPLSARKHFALSKIIEKAPVRHTEAETPAEVTAATEKPTKAPETQGKRAAGDLDPAQAPRDEKTRKSASSTAKEESK